jgi:1,4-alpha-glucan branching enzyme
MVKAHHLIIAVMAAVSFGCLTPAPLASRALDGTVLFVVQAPAASTVAVAGTFNRWDSEAHRLAGPGPDGTWTLALPLPPGRYEYLFVIDGTSWLPDPSAPVVDDGLGGRNSVIIVPSE